MSGAEDDVKMPLLEHLTELRSRLLYSVVGFVIAFVFCFYFWKPVLDIITAPLERACLAQGKPCPVIYTSLIEPFFTQIKIGAFSAFCITFPLIAAQLYKFVAPGLYKTGTHGAGAVPDRDADHVRGRARPSSISCCCRWRCTSSSAISNTPISS